MPDQVLQPTLFLRWRALAKEHVPIESSPIIVDGKVYVATLGISQSDLASSLVRIDLETGTVDWVRKFSDVIDNGGK